MKKIVAILLLACCGLSCKKDVIDITGYTETDSAGNFMGTIDLTDWTLDQEWTSKESDRMDQIPAATLTGTSSGTIILGSAYPNPFSDQFRITVNSTTKCVIRMGLFDEQLNLKWSGSQVLLQGYSSVTIAPDLSRLRKSNLYRLYYVFDAEGQAAYFKGHGDVFFQ